MKITHGIGRTAFPLAAAASALLLAMAGCAHSDSSGTAGRTPAEQPAQPQRQQIQATANETPEQEKAAAVDLSNALQDLKNTRVFFAFDDDTLTAEARQNLEKVGTILAAHPNFQIRIDGNCDERGTEEYNLALGQRRADSAKRYLMNMGAHEDQVTTVSYGKEHPVADGHNEGAWRQNRRDDVTRTN